MFGKPPNEQPYDRGELFEVQEPGINKKLDNQINTTILKRPDNAIPPKILNENNKPPERKSLHERQSDYYKARERIFADTPTQNRIQKLRERHNKKRKLYKAVSAAKVNISSEDPRPYLTVNIFGTDWFGLLDSGASISCLGVGSLEYIKENKIPFKNFSSTLATADGQKQNIVGVITTPIFYKGTSKDIDLFIVPSLQQKLYLGVDFWRSFQLAPNLISEISLVPELDANKCDLTAQETSALLETIKLFPSFSTKGLGKTSLMEHSIDTGDATPIKQRHYPVSPAVQAIMYTELDRMISLDIIEESSSAWSSPVVLVRKPGKNRLCLDFRKVNEVTKKNANPIPHIEGLLSRFSDPHYISSVDLKDAYWQIPLEKGSREKTAFTVPGRKLYQFKVMPFGLSNAAQSLTCLMHQVIPHELRDQVFVYLDDLLILSHTFEEHLKILKIIAQRLTEAGLTINVEKSKFCLKELPYLGYIVGQGGIKANPDKIAAILDFPEPKTSRQVRRFLGMAGWYRRFVKDFSTLAIL